MHQTVVSSIMKGIADAGPRSSNRGLLCWHSVGSGKTNTAMGVIDAFWDTKKRIVLATSIEALANNPPSTFHTLALTYYKRFIDMANEAGLDPSDVVGRTAVVAKAFEARGVEFLTFAQLAHITLVARPLKMRDEAERQRHLHYLNDAVVIIDEVQGLFKPLPTQVAEHTALRALFLGKVMSEAKDGWPAERVETRYLKVVILTATPGDSPQEVCDLLNMVQTRKKGRVRPPASYTDPVALAAFADSIRGLISYFDVASDTTRFPVVKQAPDQVVKMSLEQYRKYVEVYKEMTPEQRDFEALVAADKAGDYLKPARKYANMLYEMEEDMTLFEFSAKAERLFAQLAAFPTQKHYVYSAFYENRGLQSIVGVGRLLETHGPFPGPAYERLTVAEAVAVAGATTPEALPAAFVKKPRYILVTTTELKYGSLSIGECLKRLLVVFNHRENRSGEYVHVMLASQSFNEGIDLKAVRHIHIFDALLSANKEIQTIGRAARFCSHKDLERDRRQWTVKVHRYLSEFPLEVEILDVDGATDKAERLAAKVKELEEERKAVAGRTREAKERREALDTEIRVVKQVAKEAAKEAKEQAALDPRMLAMVDIKIMREVKERALAMGVLHRVMKEASVDCRLFREFHNQGKGVMEQLGECRD
jgi:hypothetical protein